MRSTVVVLMLFVVVGCKGPGSATDVARSNYAPMDGGQSPQAASWVYSHDAVVESRWTANNHNKPYNDKLCPAASNDGKWCADVVTLRAQLTPGVLPPLRFTPMDKQAIYARVRVIGGPTTHWDFVDARQDASLQWVEVIIKGNTYPQRWVVSFPVERWQEP